MKKLILLIISLTVFTSCETEKTYKYIENIKNIDLDGRLLEDNEEKEIKAKNDTLAYIKAYSKFKISEKFAHEMKAGGSPYPKEVISFNLYTDTGKDISNIDFHTKNAEKEKADLYAADIDVSYKISSNSTKSTYIKVKINPCVMSEDFIKEDLSNPSTAEFSIFNCSYEQNTDGSYTVLSKVSAKNNLGTKKEFVYKVRLGFTGGSEVDVNNWKLIGIVSNEYKL